MSGRHRLITVQNEGDSKIMNFDKIKKRILLEAYD